MNTINANYFCRLCCLMFRNPVQLVCGHRYCQSCVNDEKESSIVTCLQCNEETLKKEIFIDRGFKNDMQTLNIYCSLCNWTGIFKNYENYLNENHSNIICYDCDEKLNQHKMSSQNILVYCNLLQYGCNEQILQKDLSKHYLTEKHQCILVKAIISHKKASVHRMMNNRVLIQIRQLHEKLNEFRNNYQRLKNNIKQILSKTSIYKTSIEEQNPPEEILQEKLDNITSCDGTLLWKIDHIKSKLNDSRCVITSPPFYTSLNGYKMCVRLYLNGNGKEESTHISIFLVLMRGEYDALLDWPFNHQVIFCLYNLINPQDHIIQSFQSDINSQSFHRPQSEMNIGSGISKFIPLRIIQQENSPYVCDGSIYIKIMVRNNPIPISILPYVMNINPGLPIYIQEDMIQEEIERNHIQSLKLVLTLTSRD